MAKAFRSFNGRLYFQMGNSFRLKTDAQRKAKALRAKGFLIRTKKVGKRWFVYGFS